MNFEQVNKGFEEVSYSQQKKALRLGQDIDVQYRPVVNVGSKPTYGSTPPPEKLNILVHENVNVYGTINGKIYNFEEKWYWASQEHKIVGAINNLYIAVEKFREVWSGYLDNITPQIILDNLKSCKDEEPYDWNNLMMYHCDCEYLKKWNEVEVSEELRELAQCGRDLYTKFFPLELEPSLKSELRQLIDSLKLGTFIRISWLPNSKMKWLSHVPWGLMFCRKIESGEPINPLYFMGFCYRIEYINHSLKAQTEVLGSLNNTHRLHYLYWGEGLNEEGKEIVTEAKWLQDILSSNWSNQKFLPEISSKNPKDDVINSLKLPSPSPVNLMYLYCYCYLDNEKKLNLRFGDNIDPQYILNKYDLGDEEERLIDQPLVFANACQTLACEPNMANDLEEKFFQRGCAAYLGTESKVPIRLASRFAIIFFYFFYRRINPERVVAGEAVFQTRLFLWKYYKNIGGLFYSYVGPYGLYVEP